MFEQALIEYGVEIIAQAIVVLKGILVRNFKIDSLWRLTYEATTERDV